MKNENATGESIPPNASPKGFAQMRFIRSLLGCPVQEYLTLPLSPDLFASDCLDAYKFINQHIAQYKSMPNVSTLREAGFNWIGEVEAPEPVAFYLDKAIEYKMFSMFNGMLMNSADHLKAKSLDKIAQTIRAGVQQYETLSRAKDKVLTSADFLVTYQQEVVNDYLQTGVLTGWPTADRFGTAVRRGDVAIIAGRPGTGKTTLEVFIAQNAAAVQGKKVLFISLEMADTEISFKYAAMEHGISMTQLGRLELTTKLIDKIENTPPKAKYPVVILGNSKVRDANAIKAEVLIYAPDLLVVDAAYLMGNNNSRLSKYEKVGESINALKRIATECGIGVLASYQLNRETKKTQKVDGKPDLSNLANSDDLGQLASLVMVVDESDIHESERTVYVLKNRKGMQDQFRIAWDLEKMRFDEVGLMDDGDFDHIKDQQEPQYAD